MSVLHRIKLPSGPFLIGWGWRGASTGTLT